MSPIEVLRAAAARIRGVANAATPGPWGVGNGTNVCRDVEQLSVGSYTCTQAVTDTDLFDGREEWSDDDPKYVEVGPEDDAAHIAMWDPSVALLVASLLEYHAEVMEVMTGAAAKLGVDAAITTNDPHALALARAILGGES